MQFVKITVDGVSYNLVKTPNDDWVVTAQAPRAAGEYVMTITMTTESGKEIVLDTSDEELAKVVTLLVQNGTTESGIRMLEYYPDVLKRIADFKALVYSEGFEIDFIKSDINLTLTDAYLSTMSEKRISEWESLLGLPYNSTNTLDDRRERVIASIRGKGKLNTSLINSIVGSFTNGGTATSYIKDSVLYVKINPPLDNKQYKFPNVEESLQASVPAHLGLVVTRNYATWGEIKDNFASWESISSLDNWESLKLYIAP